MDAPSYSPRRLHTVDDAQIDELAELLIDCVQGGASVSFMHPLTRDRAVAFWRRVAQDVVDRRTCAAGRRRCARPVRHRAARARAARKPTAPGRSGEDAGASPGAAPGVGGRWLRAAEATARDCGKTLLVLDAVTDGDGARLYERLGWVRVGDIPGYALFPQGGLCSTTLFYRNLGG